MTTTTLPMPDTATYRESPRLNPTGASPWKRPDDGDARYRPYGLYLDRRFVKASPAERAMYRWLYRQFREQQHSSPFSARATLVTFIVRYEWKIRP
jgi:hypothetical protein